MTDEKAKEILDFLTGKAGYCELYIKRKYGNDKSKHFFIACKPKLDFDDTLYDIDYALYAKNHSYSHSCLDFLVISLRSMSYANALKIMLKLSKDKKDIFCRNNLILPAHTSLEEIMIEMDLIRYE